jgi:hypothetical protein
LLNQLSVTTGQLTSILTLYFLQAMAQADAEK